jgi:hypothetical protein
MHARRNLLLVLLASVLGAACAEPRDRAIVEVATTTAGTAAGAPSDADSAGADPSATTPTTTELETMSTLENPPANCRRLTDFTSDDENREWLVVNDNVMGGQSLGGLSFDGASLIFEGEINTDGGGFSSLRLPLEPEALTAHDRIVFRARSDTRSYMVTFDDSLATRDRRVSHRAPIGFDASDDWQTVSVSFDDLFPAVFGNPVQDLPFRKDLATRLGLMISDGVDGPFRLEIDWIDLCP